MSRLHRADEETAAKISELPRIVDFRNRIIHGYDTIDDATVWGIATDSLPNLIAEVESVISARGTESPD